LVDADHHGLTVGPNRSKMGMRTTPFADVAFDRCLLGPGNVLGAVGSGASIFSAAMEAERAFVFAGQIGAMERQLDDAVAYSRQRTQFDQPIGDFQAVGHRLADMKLRHDNARLQMYRAAILEAQGRPSMEAAALAKIQASEAAVASSVDAILTHGAKGYITEFGVEQDLRNVAGGVVYGGTSDVQRNIVARMLGRSR
jgi:alkylation response protein AidB-like acyl-CoA dehydrogenase